MELYERIDLDKVNYLNKLSFDDFKTVAQSSCKNEAERRVKFEMLKKFCEINIKAKGEVRRLYAYTMKTPTEVGGRLYCGNSIQGLSSKIRGFLCKGMTDIDMRNAHPCIARWLCRKHGINYANLDYYINNRDEVCERFGKNGKTLFLSALNDEKLNKRVKDDFFKTFDKECKNIQTKINALPEYKHIVDTTPLDKAHNWNGSAFNRIMCVWENKILQQVITVLNRRGINIGVLMFDGLMVYGDFYADFELLREIEREVNATFENLNMKFSYKEHSDAIIMPEGVPDYDAEVSNDDCYDHIKKEFEKLHCKIVNKAFFIKELPDGEVVMMPKTKLMDAYMEISFMDYADEKPTRKKFINRWVLDEFMRKYEDFGIYPPPLVCPKNQYNLWKPFKVATYTGAYDANEEGLKLFLGHMSVLCGNDAVVTDWFVKWTAQMFQYPATKTVVPSLISLPGGGKGSFLDLMGLMMGGPRLLVTTSPSRDVWGSFNALMINAFLVNLNEMCKKEAQESDGKIKGLITDPTLPINRKGIDPYVIKSFHRFIATTNEDEPMKFKKGDRRNVQIRSSDEKIGDMDYFTKLHAAFQDVNTQRTIYDYLMNIPDMDQFGSIPRPETEWAKDNKLMTTDMFTRWIEAMVIEHQDEPMMEFKSGVQYELFKQWCKGNGNTWDTNDLKMAVAIKRLRLPGIESGVRRHNHNVTVYNIPELKKYFMIGCQIKV